MQRGEITTDTHFQRNTSQKKMPALFPSQPFFKLLNTVRMILYTSKLCSGYI